MPDDLPMGVTLKDIDNQTKLAHDDCERCEGTGKVMDDGAPDAVPVRCPDCKGEGFIESDETLAQRRREAQADRAMDEARDREMGL